jgi:hypothetical protein
VQVLSRCGEQPSQLSPAQNSADVAAQLATWQLAGAVLAGALHRVLQQTQGQGTADHCAMLWREVCGSACNSMAATSRVEGRLPAVLSQLADEGSTLLGLQQAPACQQLNQQAVLDAVLCLFVGHAFSELEMWTSPDAQRYKIGSVLLPRLVSWGSGCSISLSNIRCPSPPRMHPSLPESPVAGWQGCTLGNVSSHTSWPGRALSIPFPYSYPPTVLRATHVCTHPASHPTYGCKPVGWLQEALGATLHGLRCASAPQGDPACWDSHKALEARLAAPGAAASLLVKLSREGEGEGEPRQGALLLCCRLLPSERGRVAAEAAAPFVEHVRGARDALGHRLGFLQGIWVSNAIEPPLGFSQVGKT